MYLFLYIRDARNKGGVKKGIINWIGLIAFILLGLILLKYLSFALVYFIPLALIFILLRKPKT
ncbi:hypothetical protein [Sanyastnella coralliicola]|uniref:hypothetical protein n=1 Tax=Sanyastnella coralliicola TaxID=3069118 RepID=UPI0027BA19CA|nr:hypothetical protein [Longitalea sp. SCSIO 12813]